MNHPDQEKTDEIAAKLLAYVRHELNDSGIEYESSLVPIHGGFETATYHFLLKGVHKELSRRLVLRLYPEFRDPIDAAWVSIVQNALAEQGHPVAKAHSICLDKSVLGGAFFVMDFLAGEPMVTAPLKTIPALLARIHVDIHATDSEAVARTLGALGINENVYRLDRQFDSLHNNASELPWICAGVDWLIENRPPEPERLVICHGDFHPMNILIQGDKVTGVVDWAGFLIADPAYDIANTIWLLSVAYKLLTSGLGPEIKSAFGPEFASVDWDRFSQQYLDAYRELLPFDTTNIGYYRVKRSIEGLIEGFRGQEVLRHPKMVDELIEFIHQVTEIRITVPE
jgi:aminoglycoside phosphotransferase (APT) family kinase protein